MKTICQITEFKKLQAEAKTNDIVISPGETEDVGYIKQFSSPYWSYLIMAGVLVAAYLFFVILGRYS